MRIMSYELRVMSVGLFEFDYPLCCCDVVVQQNLIVTCCLSVLAAKKVKNKKKFVPLSAFAT